MGIWVTEDDIKYVSDKGRKQIVVFGGDNKFLRAYGEKEQFAIVGIQVAGNVFYYLVFYINQRFLYFFFVHHHHHK